MAIRTREDWERMVERNVKGSTPTTTLHPDDQATIISWLGTMDEEVAEAFRRHIEAKKVSL